MPRTAQSSAACSFFGAMIRHACRMRGVSSSSSTRPSSTPVRVSWQVLPPDPLLPTRPDLDPARATSARDVVDDLAIDVAPGAFLRLRLAADVRGGLELPQLAAVRALDR